MKPRLLDLFCGAGGAAMGYHRAGFEVVGVDINPQPNYPFEFVQDDAMLFLGEAVLHGAWDVADKFAAIHASPPCQFASPATKISPGRPHENMIPNTRGLLLAAGLPYVIENVEAARSELHDPTMLCGSMFDPPLEVKRHRLFEANWRLNEHPWPCRHKMFYPRYKVTRSKGRGGYAGHTSSVVYVNGSTGHMGIGGADIVRRAMGMEWATGAEVIQAIPPAYTEFIGQQLLAHLRVAA